MELEDILKDLKRMNSSSEPKVRITLGDEIVADVTRSYSPIHALARATLIRRLGIDQGVMINHERFRTVLDYSKVIVMDSHPFDPANFWRP